LLTTPGEKLYPREFKKARLVKLKRLAVLKKQLSAFKKNQ